MADARADLTDFLLAARTNDPRVVQALGERLPKARFHAPLAALDGIRNRPETAVELGIDLPIHWLQLDTGEKAVPLFTSLALCRRCAERLGWETNGKGVRSLALPGDVAVRYLTRVLLAPGVERVILNPLSESELHLARTEIESIAARHPLRALWFYSRDGRMKRPVQIEGASILGTLFSRADRLLESLGTSVPPPVPLPFPETSQALEHMESQSPLGALAAQLFRLVSGEDAGPLEVTVTQSGGEVAIEANPTPSPELLARMRVAAIESLVGETGNLRLSFRIDGASIVLSSSSAAPRAEPPRPPSAPRLSYIPLEPEEWEE